MMFLLLAVVLQTAAPTPEPPIQNADAIVRADLETVLRDVETARIRQTRGPRWGTVRESAWTVNTGWAVCYSINAQNGYGGYTGAKDYLFVILNRRVEMRVKGGESLWFDGIIEDECGRPADAFPAQSSTTIVPSQP